MHGIFISSGEAELIVNIIDVNDERPVFEQSEYVFHVREHLEPFSEVGTVTAIDRDAAPHNIFTISFHKSNSETENFVVEPQTGKILTRRQLDREIQVSKRVKSLLQIVKKQMAKVIWMGRS